MISAAAQAADRAASSAVAEQNRDHLERDERRTAEHDDAREEAIGSNRSRPSPREAREEPEVREAAPVKSARLQVLVRRAEQQRGEGERHVDVAECRQLRPRHAAKLQHRP